MASLTELATRILARARALENSDPPSKQSPDYEETRLSLLDDVDSMKHGLLDPAESLFSITTAVCRFLKYV